MRRSTATCPACGHMDVKTLDRFLVLPAGTPGKRGPRSLARNFGLDRRAIARHERVCLTGARRAAVEADLSRMTGTGADEGGGG